MSSEWMNPIHSVSLADFHIQIGNTITQTWPRETDFGEFKTENLHDLCFPDGAHEAHRDTVYGVLDCKDGTNMFALGCYRSLKTTEVERGAVQRGILVVTTVPIYNAINSTVNELLEWWLCKGESRDKYNRLDDNDARTWIDLNSANAPELLSASPRNPTKAEDSQFLKHLYESLSRGFKTCRDGDRNVIVPFDFEFESCKISTELTAPFVAPLCKETVPASLSDTLGYGACLSQLISIFKHGTAKIYTALLKRQSICFVDHGNAMMVGTCVLACCHLVRPLSLSSKELVPYFTVTDCERVETAEFVVCGTTNPFYEEPDRNTWATLICSLSDGSVHTNAPQDIPRATQRLVSHVVQGVVKERRTEAWIRNFFEWSTARMLLNQGTALPLASKCAPSSYTLQECIDKTESITDTVTKCHEVNKQKTAIHNDWFSAMLDVLRAVAQRSEAEQLEMYKQIASYQLDDELAGFADITITGCGSRTERCAIAQLAYEENKTRLLLTELRERIYLLIDNMNKRNFVAFGDEENQLFCDTFNSSEYQLYNVMSQVLLHTASCTVEHRTRSDSFKANGKLWISKNYIGFTCGWLSKLGKSKDKNSVELLPFDIVTAVSAETNVVNEGIKIVLHDGCVLYISGLNETYKVRTLLETLAEKQRRICMLLGALDPAIKVPDLSGTKSPLGIPRKMVIPSGLYLYDRLITEVVWENNRSYPVAGWSGKTLLTDPPTWSDASGKHERKIDDKGVMLPSGWTWMGEWERGEWVFNTDFKKPNWKETRSKLDLCRRRKWTRVRKLEYDAFGTPLPVMMMPGDHREEEVMSGSATPRSEEQQQQQQQQQQVSMENMSFSSMRCRQTTAQVSKSPVLSPSDFRPEAVLPDDTADLSLMDFTPPAGLYNPFHSTAELPGCGALRYDTIGEDKEVVDELIAEANGVTNTPRRSHRNSIRQFKQDFKNDLRDLKTDLKASFAGGESSPSLTPRGSSPSHPVSRGVVMITTRSTSPSPSPTGEQSFVDPQLEIAEQEEAKPAKTSRLGFKSGLRSLMTKTSSNNSGSPKSNSSPQGVPKHPPPALF